MSKVRDVYIQLEPMQRLAAQLKQDKELALSKVEKLQNEMNKIIHRVQVCVQLIDFLWLVCESYTSNSDWHLNDNFLIFFNK